MKVERLERAYSKDSLLLLMIWANDEMRNDMRKANLKKMFKDKNWTQLKMKGAYPNRAWVNNLNEQAAIVVKQSSNGDDFPAGQYGCNKLAECKDKQGYVVLVDRKGNYVNHETYLKVAKIIKKQSPLDGEFGPYWWLTKDFKLADRKNEDDSF